MLVSEKWIRDKVHLGYEESVSKVESLSLPGIHGDKISELGLALQNFVFLKELDLSRNSLSSFEGLENLKELEVLNVYYNNISEVREIYHLRRNRALRELDLRLNPLSKTLDNYRIHIIHILPWLERLDEREIRESERRRAREVFGQEDLTGTSGMRSVNEDRTISSGYPSSVVPQKSPARSERSYRVRESVEHTLDRTSVDESISVERTGTSGFLLASTTVRGGVTFDKKDRARELNDMLDDLLLCIEPFHSGVQKTSQPFRKNKELLKQMEEILSPLVYGREAERVRYEAELASISAQRAECESSLQQSSESIRQLEQRLALAEREKFSVLEDLKAVRDSNTNLMVELKGARQQTETDEDTIQQTASLVQMLRESHETLTETNNVLRTQLEDARQQTARDAMQWQRNYVKLKSHYEDMREHYGL